MSDLFRPKIQFMHAFRVSIWYRYSTIAVRRLKWKTSAMAIRQSAAVQHTHKAQTHAPNKLEIYEIHQSKRE